MTPGTATRTVHGASFEASREKLWRIAYRMLGSPDEAEDVLQDVYLRWHHARAETIRSPQAWLVTATTRLCIDRLRQLRAERERYAGPWLPEPLVVEAAPSAAEHAELASDLSVAFLAVLERLAPEERAAFLLREVFETDYGEVAAILGKSEAACRQIVSRASKRIRAQRPRVQVSAAARTRLLDGLVRAVQTQDKDALLKLLAKDASWNSDGGGKAPAALKVIRGADPVARFACGVFRKLIDRVEFRPVTVNGEAGLAVFFEGNLFSVLSIRTDGRRILDVYNIMNPEKLRHVRRSLQVYGFP